MLLKLLVVIWFLKMLITPFSKNAVYRTILKQCGETLNELNITAETDAKTLSSADKTKFLGSMGTFFLFLIWKGIVYLIDFIMMLSLIKYDHTYITIIFISLSVLELIIGLIRGKINSKKNTVKIKENRFGDLILEIVKDVEKTTFAKFVMRLINILYWAYALYLLFF